MKTLTYTLLFEDHKNLWVYQRCLHSTIVMCEQAASEIIYEIIMKEEKTEERKQKLMQEMGNLL